MPHDVFISYRSEDKAPADRLCNGLESQSIACWIAPRDIPGGTEWPTAIVEAISACKIFVMVLSSHSVNAKQISREAELADKNGCQIITFRLENVDPPSGLSYFLGNIQWIDAFGDQFDSAIATVAQIIRKVPRSPTRVLPTAPSVAAIPQRSEHQRSIPWLGLAIGVVAVLIAIGVWFGFHRPTPAPIPAPSPAPAPGGDNTMSQAKAVADRFLKEREAGQLDDAWAEFTGNFQRKVDKSKWLSAQSALAQHGRLTNKFEGCTPSGNGYFCGYLLSAKDGTGQRSKLWLIRDQDGNWKISRSELLPSKS